MKKKIFLLGVLLFVGVLVGLPAFIANANVESVQEELEVLSTQKQKLTAKLEKVQQENAEAQTKMEAHQDKPKSLPYKNAVKKVESTQKKIDLYTAELLTVDQKMAELQEELIPQAEAEEPVQEETNHTEVIETIVDDVPACVDQEDNKSDSDENQSPVSTSTHDNDDKSTKASKNDGLIVQIVIILVILYLIFKIIYWEKWNTCPHCRKKWAMEVIDEQDLGTVKKEKVKKSDGTHEWVYYHKYKVTRQCKYCGHQFCHNETRKEA